MRTSLMSGIPVYSGGFIREGIHGILDLSTALMAPLIILLPPSKFCSFSLLLLSANRGSSVENHQVRPG